MITIYRRGKIWHARGSVQGKEIRCTLDTRFQDVAWERVKRIERRTDSGMPAKCVRWKDFEGEFFHWIEPNIRPSTAHKYGFVSTRFGRFLRESGDVLVENITAATIANYLGARHADTHPTRRIQVGPSGARSDLRILRRIFAYAVECKYIAENPVRQHRLNRFEVHTVPYTAADLGKMFSDREVLQKPILRALLLTFLYTGMRISDVSALKRSAIHFDTERIEVRTLKSGVQIVVPLHPELRSALIEHFQALNELQLRSGLVFPTITGRRCWEQSMAARLSKIFKRCGVSGGHAHRFRDTFAVAMLAQGASMYDVAKLLGNSVSVAERHYAPYTKELQDRGRRLVNELSLVPGVPSLAIPERSADASELPKPIWKN